MISICIGDATCLTGISTYRISVLASITYRLDQSYKAIILNTRGAHSLSWNVSDLKSLPLSSVFVVGVVRRHHVT